MLKQHIQMAECTFVQVWANARLVRLDIILLSILIRLKNKKNFWQKCKACLSHHCGGSCLSVALSRCAAFIKKALITCIVVPEAAEEIQHLYCHYHQNQKIHQALPKRYMVISRAHKYCNVNLDPWQGHKPCCKSIGLEAFLGMKWEDPLHPLHKPSRSFRLMILGQLEVWVVPGLSSWNKKPVGWEPLQGQTGPEPTLKPEKKKSQNDFLSI